MMKFLRAVAAILALTSPAAAQVMQVGPGQVIGNSTAARAPGQSVGLSPLFDQAFNGTVGSILNRSSGGWVSTINPVIAGSAYIGNSASSGPVGAVIMASSSSANSIAQRNTASAVDTKIYDWLNNISGQLQGRLINDAYNAATPWLMVSRTGMTLNSVAFPGGVVVVGLSGTTAGTLQLAGVTSGILAINPASGAASGTILVPNGPGTFAISASSPIVRDAVTGNLTCPTCATTSGGGSLSATAPLTLTGNVLALTTPLAMNFGGSNASLTASNGGLIYSTGSAMAVLAGTATAGQIPRSGSSAAPAWSTATFPATTAAGTILASSSANVVAGSATPVLGVAGTTLGTLGLAGNTSGVVTLTPQATAGTVTLTMPNTSGTIAASASGPLVLSATTGALTCATCVTSSGGGAITGTSPISVSAAGVVSIPSLTGTGATVALSASPVFSGAPFIAAATGTSLAVGAAAGSAPAVPLSVSVSGDAGIALNNTAQGSNAKIWDFVASTNVLIGRAANDTYTAATNWLAVTRSGFLISNVAFPNSPVSLGTIGSVQGSLVFSGATSGSATINAQAVASTPVLTLPTSTGTFAVVASGPLVLNSTTGALTCPTCATSSGGGAITGVAPVAVSAAGAVSITGAAGQVLAGASPAFTATPTLGVSGSVIGSLTLAGNTSGAAIITPQPIAGAPTLTLPTTTGTLASAAASPITLNSTSGQIACATCGVTGSPLSQFAATTSAQLAGVISDETGTAGSLVFSNSPALVTPDIGVATGTRLTISNATATTALTVIGASQNWSATNALNVMGAYTAYGDINRFIFQRANGTIASPTGVLTGETVLNMGTRGYTSGGAFSQNTTIIMGTAEDTYSNTALGTRLSFFTTPIGTTSITEAMRIFPSGGVGVGTTTDPGIGMLATNSASFMLRSNTSLTGGATGNVPTLTAGPVTGNPTKWLPYNDNGTTRYIPAW